MTDRDVVKDAFFRIYDHFRDAGRVITYINYQIHGNLIVGFWEKNNQRGGFVEYNVHSPQLEDSSN
jgi:hypothetical protein